MKDIRSQIAVLCALMMCAPPLPAQQPDAGAKPADQTPRLENEGPHWYSRFTQRYNPMISRPSDLTNSPRIEQLIRGGNLYLSLQDAIALALENNIDIEIQRYQYPLANQSLKAALAGAPSGAGPALYNLDPVLTGNLNWGHTTNPSPNSVTTGIIAPVNVNKLANFGISQGFLTGTNAALTMNNNTTTSSSYTNLYNPSTTSYLDLTVTQHLLQGFGLAVNSRGIRVAKNNLKVADLTFQQQVITTVSSVITQYWTLVNAIENADVAQRALTYSQSLYENNQKQVEIGTLARVEVTRALAEVKADQKTLITAKSNVYQEETVLKNVLSRNGLSSQDLASARIIPTDRIHIPDTDPIQPIQEMVSQALMRRPDLEQARVQLVNSKINLTGTRASLLPTLDAVADLRNGGLSGTPNSLVDPLLSVNPGLTNPGNLSYSVCYTSPGLCRGSSADPFFVGGYGSVLGQIFSRNFPNYSIGLQLNIPLRNRQAQANMATAQLQLSQNELTLTKAINQVQVDVQNALTALQQARAGHDAAVETVTLEEQLLDAENKKLQLGTSTPFNVISVQRDLANAELSEVQALVSYGLAQVQLNQALGMTLETNHVELDEAKSGKVSRGPSPIPDVNPPNGAAATPNPPR